MTFSLYDVLIQGIFAPFVMLIYFLASVMLVILPSRATPDRKGPARRIAFVLGITVFAMLVAIRHGLDNFLKEHPEIPPFPTITPDHFQSAAFGFFGIVIGVFFCGFVFILLVPNDFSEYLVLSMTVVSLSCIYVYYFEVWLREVVALLIIGNLIGMLTCALVGSQLLPDAGLVWICNNCGNHNFFFDNACQCSQTLALNRAENRALNSGRGGGGAGGQRGEPPLGRGPTPAATRQQI
jgi:hypothetical protein